MNAQPNVAAAAALIGEPTRAAILTALLGGQSLLAGELAARARVSPQTASAHLAKLVAGSLLVVEAQGRHRSFRLANDRVAHVVEALGAIAPRGQVRSLGESLEVEAMRSARTCYDHLAGRLGVALTRSLLDQEYLKEVNGDFCLTPSGEEGLTRWGIDVERARRTRRKFAFRCLDWSEQRYHLAGALGAAITAQLSALQWIRRLPGGRAVQVTAAGRSGFWAKFQVDVGSLVEPSQRADPE